MLSIVRTLLARSGAPGGSPRIPAYPAAPTDICLYVIGDIHGRADLLLDVFQRIDRDWSGVSVGSRTCLEVYLGDYIDRGPQSRRVIDLLIERCRSRTCVFVRGNHEATLLRLIGSPFHAPTARIWLQIGGIATAVSYGAKDIPRGSDDEALAGFVTALRAAVPPAHQRFLQETVECFNCGPYVFAHAGIRPGVALEEQATEDLFWIREPFLDATGDHGFIVVHGHTAVIDVDFRPNRINIDTGAYATGKLTCLRIDHRGPRPLPPTGQ